MKSLDALQKETAGWCGSVIQLMEWQV